MRESTYAAEALHGRTVYASDGEKLGTVDDILTDEGGCPEYLETKSGWFGTRRHVIPVSGLTETGDDLTVPWTKAELEAAPTYDEGDAIDYDRERELSAHYGHAVPEWDARGGDLTGEDLSRGPTPQTRHPAGGRDDVEDTTQGPTPETRQAMRMSKGDAAASGQPASDRETRGDTPGNQDTGREFDPGGAGDAGASGSLTRSEEELRLATHREAAGRVRLRKWVESEHVTGSVPVEREQARVTREPITDGTADGATIGERELELTLEEDVVDAATVVVPKERIGLEKEVTAEQQQVEADLRRERIEIESDEGRPR